ncbi:MAG: polysaccharide deacetylase family protein [Actinobacteria bacterium]|jgi:peptidoglycan/xylan/chitin deacetylase (PgdA/CDA1 family)|nr:polysaccharide deacetylase family protein [Actinomycetota bacterium]
MDKQKLVAPGLVSTSFLALIALGAHSLPAATAIGPIRRSFFTKLSGVSGSKNIALTFDDGPDPKSTPLFLDLLDELGIKATFFMLGSMAEKSPGLVVEVRDRGHEIALHGYHHNNLLFRTPKFTREDINKGYDILAEITDQAPHFYRPPYGVLNSQAIVTSQKLGLTTVLWTSWGRDWRKKATPSSVVDDLNKHLKSGATLLLHDSDCTSAKEAYRSALGALKPLAELVKVQNLQFERMCDHF